MKVLGSILREKRKELNLTIQDVADKLNLKYGTVANMESGGKNPTLKQLEDYGLIFGVTWIEILTEILRILQNNVDNSDSSTDEGNDYIKMQFAEFHEYESYYDEIKKEHDARIQAEDEKINIDIDAAIDIIAKRWTTKGDTPVTIRETVFLREEIKSIILNRVKHLLVR